MGSGGIDISEEAVELGKELIKALEKTSRKSLKAHRRLDRGFTRRNHKRWQQGFNNLYTMISVSGELVASAVKEIIDETGDDQNPKLFALQCLNARGIRISRECLCLMESGFADGALARWRTLFELTVISNVIAQSEEQIAVRFLESRAVKSSKEISKYVSFQKQANLVPISPEEVKRHQKIAEDVMKNHGSELKQDHGWASPLVLNKDGTKNQRPNLSHLMEIAGFQSWAPRYSWAHQEIHGGFIPPDKGLGMSEAHDSMLLVGPSNSGMVDPAQHVAYHLYAISLPILNYRPAISRQTSIYVLDYYKSKTEKAFLSVQHETSPSA